MFQNNFFHVSSLRWAGIVASSPHWRGDKCAEEVLWGTGDANITKTGFPKSRSVAFKRSSVFDFYLIVCFFEALLSSLRLTRVPFLQSLFHCARMEWHLTDEWLSLCAPSASAAALAFLWGQTTQLTDRTLKRVEKTDIIFIPEFDSKVISIKCKHKSWHPRIHNGIPSVLLSYWDPSSSSKWVFVRKRKASADGQPSLRATLDRFVLRASYPFFTCTYFFFIFCIDPILVTIFIYCYFPRSYCRYLCVQFIM